ncbi:MAG: methionyl-tRNA formyltransferase [candidate division Zixibacteria bacterium]|nr:methionyl-tRNA formyltransferase [candidate division Zixibacteria bacterium]
MRIVFMGTPEFACANLTCLCQSRHEVVGVVTGRDKPTGRGRRLAPTLVCNEAAQHKVPVFKPKSLKSKALHDELRALGPDLFVVAAFRVLPPTLFDLPRLGSINIHGSLLPKYRGAAPINWALINGEKETGLTSFFLKEKVDTGDMILQEKISIADDETFDTLYDRLCTMAGPFLLKTLDLIEKGESAPIPQNDTEATPAPKLTPFDALIDFGLPAENVRNFVRGMATRPGAWTWFRGKKTKIHACVVSDFPPDPAARPGTVLPSRKKLLVQCNNSVVELLKVVPEGKREMDGMSFRNGFRPETGEVFGDVSQRGQENQ